MSQTPAPAPSPAVQGYSVEDVEFVSEGAVLRGMLLRPRERDPKPPIVIMAHGITATVTMVADQYAASFARAGFAVLLYDHRNLGRSGGEPRQEVNPWVQCRGYRAAMDFAETLDTVDVDRISIWGDSYSGGEVILVGAIDGRVKAVVTQCPALGAVLPPEEANRANFDSITETLLRGDVAGSPETTVGPLPVVSCDQMGTPSLLQPIQAYRWFIDYGGRAGSHWANYITRVVPATPVPYSPLLCAPFLEAPILMMVAPEDEMEHANYDVAKHAFGLMPHPKQWYDIRDGHFGLLHFPGAVFDEATKVQAQFLREWL